MRKATSWKSLAPSDETSLQRPAEVQVTVPLVVFAQFVVEDEILDLLDGESGFLLKSGTVGDFRTLIAGATKSIKRGSFALEDETIQKRKEPTFDGRTVNWDDVVSYLHCATKVIGKEDGRALAVSLFWNMPHRKNEDLCVFLQPQIPEDVRLQKIPFQKEIGMDLEMVLLAMRTRGQLDKYFQSLLRDLLLYDGSCDDPVPLSPSSTHFLTRFHQISDFTFTTSVWNNFANAFSSNDDTVALDALGDLEKQSDALSILYDKHATDRLEAMLIALTGHRLQRVRESAIVRLNMLYDGTNWQREAPLDVEIQYLDTTCTAQIDLRDIDCNIKSAVVLWITPASSHLWQDEGRRGMVERKMEILTDGQTATSVFGHADRCGYYDWRLVIFGEATEMPVTRGGSVVQGRIIIQKDMRQEVIHETWPDVEGSRWNRNTSVLSTRGSFDTVKDALPNFKKHGVTSVYVMGALQRDNGPGPSFERSDASPLAVTDRSRPNEMLGGESKFSQLVKQAHDANLNIFVDSLCRVSASRPHRKYRDLVSNVIDVKGRLQPHYGTDGAYVHWVDTVLLNYRRKEAWDMTSKDLLKLLTYKVDGFRLDSAWSWPPIIPADLDELQLTQGETDNFDVEDILFGKIVKRHAQAYQYWDPTRFAYPCPMLIKLTQQIWAKHRSFVFLGDTTAGFEKYVIVSGAMPFAESPISGFASVFGKKISRIDASIQETTLGSVNELRTWYDTILPSLPVRSQVLKASTNHDGQYPAKLFGRGAWANVDFMFFTPEIPCTFIGEHEGFGKKVDLTMMAVRSARPLFLTSEMETQRNAAADATAASIIPISSEATRPDPRQLTRYAHLEYEQQLKQNIGPEWGFNLDMIGGHYIHRANMRKQFPILTFGKMKMLRASTGRHFNEAISNRVLAFSRVSTGEEEPYVGREGIYDFAIIAINLSSEQSRFYVDCAGIKEQLMGEDQSDFVLELRDAIGSPQSPLYLSSSELLHSEGYITLHPFASLLWVVKKFKITDKKQQLFESAVMRLLDGAVDLSVGYQQKDGWVGVENNPILVALKDATDAKSPDAVHSLLETLASYFSLDRLPFVAGALHRVLAHLATEERTTFAWTVIHKLGNSPTQAAAPPPSLAVNLAKSIISANALGPVVFIAPELGKWSTVGGLGVMVDELTQGLVDLGVDVIVISPYYDRNRKGETGYLARDNINHETNVTVDLGSSKFIVGVHSGTVNGVKLYFLHHPTYFPTTYPDGSALYRLQTISLFAKASLETLCKVGIVPAIIVTNDWFTGLVPAYVHGGRHFGRTFAGTTCFHLVHNLAADYEGRIFPDQSENLAKYDSTHGLPPEFLVDPYWHKPIFNPSRCALLTCHTWGTVSLSYRDELLQFSDLAPLLRLHAHDAFAYSNGIRVLQRRAFLQTVSDGTHAGAKRELQKKYFKTVSDDIAVFAFVGRITWQKGVHLILDAIDYMIRQHQGKIQILVGGKATYAEEYSKMCAQRMNHLRSVYPDNFWADPDMFFTDGPLVNLGADFGLMPSVFEPGGVVQHEFFAAGTPIICFSTGGLKDSVDEWNAASKSGNGCLFEVHDTQGMIYSMDRALKIFQTPDHYAAIRENAFNSVIDCTDVSKAYLRNFLRLRSKIPPPEEETVVVERVVSAGVAKVEAAVRERSLLSKGNFSPVVTEPTRIETSAALPPTTESDEIPQVSRESSTYEIAAAAAKSLATSWGTDGSGGGFAGQSSPSIPPSIVEESK